MFFPLSKRYTAFLGPTRPRIQWIPGVLSKGGKAVGQQSWTNIHLLTKLWITGAETQLPVQSWWHVQGLHFRYIITCRWLVSFAHRPNKPLVKSPPLPLNRDWMDFSGGLDQECQSHVVDSLFKICRHFIYFCRIVDIVGETRGKATT
jgi:hypothetical protein